MLISAEGLFAQNPYWLLSPHQLRFTSTGFTSTSSGPGPISGSYTSSNAAYDEAGALLFFVENGSIYTSSGSNVGSIGSGGPNGEVAIVPRPGRCDQYYVLRWASLPFINLRLEYCTVTVTGQSVSVSSSSTLRLAGYVHIGGIAVSKPINA
jgi:hypothetical protein